MSGTFRWMYIRRASLDARRKQCFSIRFFTLHSFFLLRVNLFQSFSRASSHSLILIKMKFLFVASFAVAASAFVVVPNGLAKDVPPLTLRAAGCNADNCLRAVRATRFGTATMEVRLAECSSFLAVTETATASYVSITRSRPLTYRFPF